MLLEKKIIVQIRDALSDRPASANDTLIRLGQLYDWAIETGILPETTINPALSIKRVGVGYRGAIPWTPRDIELYCNAHPIGSKARLLLILHTFTGCRIGDAVWLGADQEKRIQVTKPGWVLEWETRKTGTTFIVPMLPQLYEATRPFATPGKPYMTKDNGEPYSSAASLGQMFGRWCREAGLEDRTSHGIRKMVAGMIATNGGDGHAISALLGHTNTQTTEVYTRAFDRQIAAASAIARLGINI